MITFNNSSPNLNDPAFVADGAKLIGAVKLESHTSIWFNAVLRADIQPITVGAYSNVQDNAVVHVDHDLPTTLEDYVTIGHLANIHGCYIEEGVLVGMGATILSGAKIGKGSIIAAGAVVRENQQIPPYSLVAGVPGKILKEEQHGFLDKNISHAKNYWALAQKYLKNT